MYPRREHKCPFAGGQHSELRGNRSGFNLLLNIWVSVLASPCLCLVICEMGTQFKSVLWVPIVLDAVGAANSRRSVDTCGVNAFVRTV